VNRRRVSRSRAKLKREPSQELLNRKRSLIMIKVRVAYSVIVIARGRAGEQKISLGPALLEEENLPKPVASVEFNIGDYYQLTQRQQAPNRARIVLDFMKPPPFDLSIPSLAPTPKDSSIEVVGNHSMWVSGVFEKLISTLQQGRLRTGWLHARYTYDLLVFVGLPGAVAAATLFGQWLGRRYFAEEALPQLAGFILALWVSLLVFRLSFSAIRWLLHLSSTRRQSSRFTGRYAWLSLSCSSVC
jgi:hypothetical protein